MAVNLFDEKSLNDFIFKSVYKSEDKSLASKELFKDLDEEKLKANKEMLAKGMVYQWMKLRLRNHLIKDEGSEFLSQVKYDESLPDWAKNSIKEGRGVYNFDGEKVPKKLAEEISDISEFLQIRARNHINFEIDRISQNGTKNKKIKLEPDYLKKVNEFSDFEKTLYSAVKYKELLEKSKDAKDKDEYSKKATENVKTEFEFGDGMKLVRLQHPKAVAFEGENMGHCLSRPEAEVGYLIDKGVLEFYSLRDKNDRSHVTMMVERGELIECKGRGDKPPVERYIPYLKKIIDRQKIEADQSQELIRAGLLRQDNEWYNLYELDKYFSKEKPFVIKTTVDFSDRKIDKIPFDFSTAIVEGNFNIYKNKITSLKGSPLMVKGFFSFAKNNIKSFEGAPKQVDWFVNGSDNPLTNFENCPKVGKDLKVANTKIESLKGCQEIINGELDISGTNITSFKDSTVKEVKTLNAKGVNSLESLDNVPKYEQATLPSYLDKNKK